MNNKVVFIAVTAGGIGFEMAKQFEKDGAIVAISDFL